ncbi:MAG: aspartate/glutamate racemase family protein [Pararhodobacter sp.]
MVLNPNTSPRVTALLRRAALNVAHPDCTVVVQSVAAGPAALRTASDLENAEREVLAVVRSQNELDGLVIAAFGDPGLEKAQAAARFSVVGLGMSGIMAAAARGRFVILTLGPQMDTPLRARVAQLGCADRLIGIRYLQADIPDVADKPERFLPEIEAEAQAAAAAGAQVLLLGGAPFAGLCDLVRAPIPVVDGLREAFDQLVAG